MSRAPSTSAISMARWCGTTDALDSCGRYPVPGDPKELYCGSHKLYHANGDIMPHDETPMVDALRKGDFYRDLEVQADQRQGIVINDLNHWVKIAAQTFREGVTGDAPKRFESRLMALSRP